MVLAKIVDFAHTLLTSAKTLILCKILIFFAKILILQKCWFLENLDFLENSPITRGNLFIPPYPYPRNNAIFRSSGLKTILFYYPVNSGGRFSARNRRKAIKSHKIPDSWTSFPGRDHMCTYVRAHICHWSMPLAGPWHPHAVQTAKLGGDPHSRYESLLLSSETFGGGTFPRAFKGSFW